MPIFELLPDDVTFPPPYLAHHSGILAVGGDLSVSRLIEAYATGIFPWFNQDEPPIWHSPDPRYVIFPSQVNISKSMRQVLRSQLFKITFDQDFKAVMEGCRYVMRNKQEDPLNTWITDDLMASYQELHRIGFMHSVEVWQNDELVGGLYGGCMGKCFFGESMFAKVSNASKAGFIILAKNLEEYSFQLIDCQAHNPHLESLGAYPMPRKNFLQIVENNAQRTFVKENWNDKFRSDFSF